MQNSTKVIICFVMLFLAVLLLSLKTSIQTYFALPSDLSFDIAISVSLIMLGSSIGYFILREKPIFLISTILTLIWVFIVHPIIEHKLPEIFLSSTYWETAIGSFLFVFGSYFSLCRE
ncbi:hypothetical protein [Photobacterium sp. GB-72]|uniref:hypothetical protein n=1 Tax=Photobacterium sp. GB-72 TaxID=2022105 RepID=UPI000D15E289|nr:hypothetical protein [Photobacterium sp. GB-72]PSV27654.1 hypothetical protein C9J40_20170 [Photobacterium sp. GB-72]